MDIRSLAEAVMETAGKIKNDNMSDQDFYKFKFTELNQKSSKELFFLCVPGMALIQLEINQPQVFTAKCNEPQVVVSDGKDGGSGVVILLSVRTET